MGHQYRQSGHFDDLGMRRIFPIVLIRGIRLPRFGTDVVVRTEPDLESPVRPIASGSRHFPLPHNPEIVAQTIRIQASNEMYTSPPLRRSPRLNKGIL